MLDALHGDDYTHKACHPVCWKWSGGGAEIDPSSPGFQIRKGVSASAVPFTPSSPLLSCSQEGSRHPVMFPALELQGQLNEMWAWALLGVQVQGCEPHPPPLPCTLQSKLSRHGSGADSDYENTQSGDPLLG